MLYGIASSDMLGNLSTCQCGFTPAPEDNIVTNVIRRIPSPTGPFWTPPPTFVRCLDNARVAAQQQYCRLVSPPQYSGTQEVRVIAARTRHNALTVK